MTTLVLFLAGVYGAVWAQPSSTSQPGAEPTSRMMRQRPTGDEGDAGRKGMGATIKRAKRDFEHIDTDNDNRLSPTEWLRRGNFENLDTNADGYLSFEEMAAMYRPKPRLGKLLNPQASSTPPQIDPSHDTDRVPPSGLAGLTLCGIDRESCSAGVNTATAAAAKLGLVPTGLGPRFPAGSECLGIDDYYALDYGYKRSHSIAHGGLDIPAPQDTPILAVAAGTVVGRFQGDNTQRGVEVILRHSPEDTGLPFWVYTQYAHLAALPQQALGQRVRMGEVIGLTSNTGLDRNNQASDHRRPALHFVAWYSPVRTYANTGGAIVPDQGKWMDPHSLYRGVPPFDADQAAKLPEADKWVDIPVMYGNGATQPRDTRLIWPYACLRQR